MFKRKKTINYYLAGNENQTPITRDELESYHELSMFFVSSDGLILPITTYTDHNVLSRLTNGKYMYKDQVKELIFGS